MEKQPTFAALRSGPAFVVYALISYPALNFWHRLVEIVCFDLLSCLLPINFTIGLYWAQYALSRFLSLLVPLALVSAALHREHPFCFFTRKNLCYTALGALITMAVPDLSSRLAVYCIGFFSSGDASGPMEAIFSFLLPWIPIAANLLVFWLLLIRPERKKRIAGAGYSRALWPALILCGMLTLALMAINWRQHQLAQMRIPEANSLFGNLDLFFPYQINPLVKLLIWLIEQIRWFVGLTALYCAAGGGITSLIEAKIPSKILSVIPPTFTDEELLSQDKGRRRLKTLLFVLFGVEVAARVSGFLMGGSNLGLDLMLWMAFVLYFIYHGRRWARVLFYLMFGFDCLAGLLLGGGLIIFGFMRHGGNLFSQARVPIVLLFLLFLGYLALLGWGVRSLARPGPIKDYLTALALIPRTPEQTRSQWKIGAILLALIVLLYLISLALLAAF